MPQPTASGHPYVPDPGTSLDRRLARWRERLLDRILGVLAVLGGVTLVVSVGFMIQIRDWTAASVMSAGYLLVLAAWRMPSLGYGARASTVLFIGWVFGVYLTVGWGPVAAGNSFFFAVPVLAALLFGRSGSYRAFALVAISVAGLTVGVAAEVFPWARVPSELPHLGTFVSRALSMLFLSGGMSLGITVLSEGLAREASARADAERERLELAAAVEQSADLMLLIARNGHIRYANAVTRALVGPERASFANETVQEWFDTLEVIEGDSPDPAEAWMSVLAGERWTGTLRLHDPRPPVPADLTVSGTLSPMHDDRGEVEAVLGVFRDVRRERELEAQLRQASKLQAVGTLVSGIAHDFNNLLQPILLNAGSLEKTLKESGSESASERQFLVDIRNAAERGASLVRRILTFTREAEIERAPVALDGLAEETAGLIRASIPANIDLDVRSESDLVVLADRSELQQVLLNLATNAAHAMPDGGRLSIHITRRPLGDDPEQRIALDGGPGIAEIAVSDTGTGMDVATIERIFEPFFTTKPPGSGTGLGLASAHGTVMALGGAVIPESEPGVGTTMRVLLPLVESAPGQAASLGAEAGDERAGVRHVLLVDDEPLVLRATERMLASADMIVTTCGDPREALESMAATDMPVDCVVTDYSMPGLDGLRLSRRIRDAHPRVPVILVTGFLGADREEEIAHSGVTLVLSKPFRRPQLLEAIEEASGRMQRGGSST